MIRNVSLTGLSLCAMLAMAPAAQASFVVNFIETGPNVVATGSGSINTTALTAFGISATSAVIFDSPSTEITGPITAEAMPYWVGFTGPTGSHAFTTGFGFAVANPGSGAHVGIEMSPVPGLIPDGIVLSPNYVSGAPLTSSATWATATFASLGLIPGSYTWSWGSGADADHYTLNIGAVPMPEPSSLVLLLGSLLALLLAVGPRRRAAY